MAEPLQKNALTAYGVRGHHEILRFSSKYTMTCLCSKGTDLVAEHDIKIQF